MKNGFDDAKKRNPTHKAKRQDPCPRGTITPSHGGRGFKGMAVFDSRP